MRLTKTVVDAARYRGDGASRFVLWDDDVAGFGVRVFPSGRRSFVVTYRASGRQRYVTLGAYGPLTVQQARAAARQVLAAVARGEDPAAEREHVRTAGTVTDLAERFLAVHSPKLRPSTVREYRRLLGAVILPRLGARPVAAVIRADVERQHHAIRDAPVQANRVLALLSKMFNLAERWGLRPDGSNPCHHLDRYPEARRERFLSGAELARVAVALEAAERDGSESPWAVAAIRLLIFTGARMSEVLTMRWQDVDLAAARWRLAEHKTSGTTGAKRIPLPAPARAVLAGLPRTAGNPYVIEGRLGGAHLTDLEKPWQRIRKAAGLEDVRLHDLRHSHASAALAAGLPLAMVGALLGHRSPAVTARYAHLAADAVQEAAELVAGRIAGDMAARREGERSGAVVPLNSKR